MLYKQCNVIYYQFLSLLIIYITCSWSLYPCPALHLKSFALAVHHSLQLMHFLTPTVILLLHFYHASLYLLLSVPSYLPPSSSSSIPSLKSLFIKQVYYRGCNSHSQSRPPTRFSFSCFSHDHLSHRPPSSISFLRLSMLDSYSRPIIHPSSCLTQFYDAFIVMYL